MRSQSPAPLNNSTSVGPGLGALRAPSPPSPLDDDDPLDDPLAGHSQMLSGRSKEKKSKKEKKAKKEHRRAASPDEEIQPVRAVPSLLDGPSLENSVEEAGFDEALVLDDSPVHSAGAQLSGLSRSPAV